ncbi:aspartate aminotransferase family protein [Gemmatimonadota bacterium]
MSDAPPGSSVGTRIGPGGSDFPPLGDLLPAVRVPPPGPRSRELARRLGAVESRNITRLTPEFPVFWERAAGANVVDVDGNRYLDLTGAFGVAVCGHTSPDVVTGIKQQAERLIHGMGDVHPPAVKVEFLEALARLAPWPSARVILGSSGSEAVEAALKTALLATGKPGILAFEGAYHGLTLGALAVTHREDFRGPFRSRTFQGVRFAPFPREGNVGDQDGSGCLEMVARILKEGGPGGAEIGSVIVEPIQGRGGVRIPPPGFLRELADLTREAGALLIFDEIFTGLGRTGQLFAFHHEHVLPDLLCLGKGLGGGLPLSACIGPQHVMEAWPVSSGEAIHTSTFLGNPLACSAGLAFLRELEEKGLVERSRHLGVAFRAQLEKLILGSPLVWEVRGRGLFLGVELVEPGTGAPLVGGGGRVAERALREGLLVLPAGPYGEVVEISPPLVLSEMQMEWAVPVLAELLLRAAP